MQIQDEKVRFVLSTLRILFFCLLLKRMFYIFSAGRHRFHDLNDSIYCAFLMCDHKTNDEMYII